MKILTKTEISGLVAVVMAVLLLATAAQAEPGQWTQEQGQLLEQINKALSQASNRANLRADVLGLSQRGATMGRMKTKKAAPAFKDATINWDEVSGAEVVQDKVTMGGKSDWWVRVSGAYPGFFIQLGYFDNPDDAKAMADMVWDMARLSGAQ